MMTSIVNLTLAIISLLSAYSVNGYELASPQQPPCQEKCLIRVKCSLVENFVYGTDGEMCICFKNQCIFNNENCNRQNSCIKPLLQITADECKYFRPSCDQACSSSTNCTEDGTPIYATDFITCNAYSNCQLNVANCERENHYKSPLTVVTAEECRNITYPCYDQCPFDLRCPNIGTGVYGFNGENCMEFSNTCFQNTFNCDLRKQCKQPYLLTTKEECDELAPTGAVYARRRRRRRG